MKYRTSTLAIAALATITVITLIVLECMLQTMPVRSYIPMQPVTREQPVLAYQPNVEQLYSAGWNFQAQNTGKTNAQGYLADFDFVTESDKPLIAVVGDSYIEARMVPFKDTIQQRLNVALGDKHRVYGIGIGGSPLSEYLIFAQFMRDNYKPEFLIVNIVANDFDESMPKYKNMPRFNYFIADDSGVLRPGLIKEYHPSWIKDLISNSALVRYVYFHLDLANLTNRILFKLRGGEGPAYAGNTDASVDETRIYDSRQAVNIFLRLLPEYAGLPANRILLVLDGTLENIYNGTDGSTTYFGQMRSYLKQQAERRKIPVLDLQPFFESDYQGNQQRYDFPYDGHWNANAHGLAAREILDAKPLTRYLSGK
jgi:hypothetical protein